MGQRKQALGRIWTLLWQVTIGYVIALLIGILAAVWAVLDILWQLLSGRNTFSEKAAPAQWISRAMTWAVGQTVYGLTGGGDGEWRALP